MATGSAHGGTDLGRRIREQREAAGLTQEATASHAGMAPSYLSYLETSPEAFPTPAALARLAAALGTSSAALAGAGMDLPPGQASGQPQAALQALSPEECRGYLAMGGVGRFLFVTDRGPVAIPVNYRMLDGDVVFRTSPNGTPAAAGLRERVSFEVDHLDDALAEGWSVLVSGHAWIVSEPGELAAVERLHIVPWAGGDRDCYLRLAPAEITGRRIRTHP